MTNGTERFSGLQATLRTRLEQMKKDAESTAGTAQKAAQAIAEILEKGGTLDIQPQMNFLTGAHARMVKDYGVIEFLLRQGVSVRKPLSVR